MNRGLVGLLGVALQLACGDDGSGTTEPTVSATADKNPTSISSAGDGQLGTLRVLVEPGVENSGHAPGASIARTADGWIVRYDRFLATAGQFSAYASSDGPGLTSDSVYVVDLLRAFPADPVLFQLEDAGVGHYDDYRFSMPTGAAAVEWNGTAADRDFMRQHGYSLYLEGVMTRPDQWCHPGATEDCAPARTVRFKWGLAIGTRFSGCAGFDVREGAITDVVWFIPNDRWFLTGFKPEAETGPRKAQWVADADLDRDGETTIEELRKISATSLLSSARGYDLEDAPIPIYSGYDFLAAQVHAMGLDGANGCSTASATN